MIGAAVLGSSSVILRESQADLVHQDDQDLHGEDLVVFEGVLAVDILD